MKNRFSLHFCMILVGFTFAVIIFSPFTQRAVSQIQLDGKEKITLDVPYEPSSEEVVKAMLEIAKVDRNDIVYDLGCGDGRIVITAAQKVGARGVGVDLDPERVKESLENARKANVTDRVEFFQQDLFQTDISKATVVMLYLWPEVNLKLRPKLLRELKAGTRVVSHSHDMGDWETDLTFTASEGHRVHFWVIPANVTGVWNWDMPGEKDRYVLKLNQKFQKISGTLQSGSGVIPIKNLELRGDRLMFTLEKPFKGQMKILRFMGHVRGHFIEGTAEELTSGSQVIRPWKTRRDSSSMKPFNFK